MPIYSFECQECLSTFDVRATIREKEAGLHPTCPQCQSDYVEYVIRAGLVLRLANNGDTPRPGGCCGSNSSEGCC